MGWPPCGRSIGHWFSLKERGSYFAIWNIAHNIGGGLAGILAAFAASNYGWQAAFYFPGIIAVIGSCYLFWRLRDTPQSVGLPSIEEYKNALQERACSDMLSTESIVSREKRFMLFNYAHIGYAIIYAYDSSKGTQG